jgi:large repetitive protein
MTNEVDYDQVGGDTGGFVEIKNVGDTAATLDGLALVFVNGGDGTEYSRSALTGTLAAGAYVVVAKDAQNRAPDGLALIDTATGDLLDALSYEGAITAAVIGDKTYSLVEGTVLPATVADSNTIDGSLIRSPDGKDTNDAAVDWAFTSTPTPAAANVLTS